ncbi:uncharacterized protein LOC106468201 [Limulus polyphemus]|uniref:Uncharacterized protein LOC106468201 n=1 Tax=Limulus polyphemus TaxID=6850 RepID=A0ABM1BKY1_LIMPO|nr:uncharacterized protein LOC106468201 [Limulus polyphemus]
MSVSDPLLKELKGHVFELRRLSEVAEVRDHNPTVLPFCSTVEKILRKGLSASPRTAFGPTTKDYWYWLEILLVRRTLNKLPVPVCDAIELVKCCKKVQTNQGRGRLFLRIALMKKFLSVTIEHLCQEKSLVQSFYGPTTSILGNEILAEIFQSLLHEISQIKFRLNLKNASFLDETWLLGIYKMYEFVPCKDLGVSLGFVKGRAIAVDIREGSVGAEDDQIEVGDVLDELYGEPLFGCRKGLVSSLMERFQGLPVYACVIKCSYFNWSLYPPLRELLMELKVDVRNLESRFQRKAEESESTEKLKIGRKLPPHALVPGFMDLDEVPVNSPGESAGFKAVYLGVAYVGNTGKIEKVEEGIKKVLITFSMKKNVLIDVGETKVTVCERHSRHVLISKHFTEISACGRRTDIPEYFAFIAGETTCTVAKEFHCYVFESENYETSKTILCSIAQGFGRTHWVV